MMTASLAQDIRYSYASSQGIFQSNKNWSWGPKQYGELRFIIQKNTILVSDEAQSTYRLTQKVIQKTDDGYGIVGWEALDEKDLKCRVIMIFHVNTNTEEIIIQYNKVAFRYFMKN
jgi:hypothetical protein